MLNSHSVTFIIDGVSKNTWTDWHLVPTSRPTLAFPELKAKTVDIPGSDGVLDLSDSLTGYPVYNNRTGQFVFYALNNRPAGLNTWIDVYEDLAAFLHGRKGKMILADDDPMYYYEGRFAISEWASNANWSQITIDYEVKPYKLSVTDSSTDIYFKDIPVTANTSTTKEIYQGKYGIAPTTLSVEVTLSGAVAIGAKFYNPRLGIEVFRTFNDGVTEIPEFVLYGPECDVTFNPPVDSSPFDPTKVYSVGSFVTYSGHTYICVKDIIPATAWNSSKWTLQYATPVFDPTKSYSVGDKVSRVSNVYECAEAVVPSTEFDASNWDNLGDTNYPDSDDYSEELTYAVNAYIVHNNYIYRCTTEVVIPEPFDSSKWTQVSAADIFDPEDTYSIDDYIIYNGVIYLCTKNVVPSSAFDATQWTFIRSALTFEETRKYAVGEYVIHEDSGIAKLYLCSTAVTPSKAFTASDWEQHSGYIGGGAGTVTIIFRKGML